jgi:hypothetical protein
MKLGEGSFGVVYKVYFQLTWHVSINLFLIEMFVKINFRIIEQLCIIFVIV